MSNFIDSVALVDEVDNDSLFLFAVSVLSYGEGGGESFRDYSLDFDYNCETLSEIVSVGDINIVEIVPYNVASFSLNVNGNSQAVNVGANDINIPKNALLIWDIIRENENQIAVIGVKYKIM